MKTTEMKGQGKQIKVEAGKHETCKKGYIVKVGRFEILFSEKGNVVSVLEDLDEQKFK